MDTREVILACTTIASTVIAWLSYRSRASNQRVDDLRGVIAELRQEVTRLSKRVDELEIENMLLRQTLHAMGVNPTDVIVKQRMFGEEEEGD